MQVEVEMTLKKVWRTVTATNSPAQTYIMDINKETASPRWRQ